MAENTPKVRKRLARIKSLLMRIGGIAPARAITCLALSIKYLDLGRWMRQKGYKLSHRFAEREQLFDHVAKAVADRAVLYLEFGVYEGTATRYWSRALLNPNSNLHGFDSFEGLPEDWNSECIRGYFSAGGRAPQIDDNRVKFFKGWFEETLPNYKYPEREVLVVNMDADLYSSTIFVLRELKDQIIPGTYIFFDEFNTMEHEFRAFDEFINETGMRFSLVGFADSMQHVVFRRED
jgi:hypothetical protein